MFPHLFQENLDYMYLNNAFLIFPTKKCYLVYFEVNSSPISICVCEAECVRLQ